ncbi:unnamed protein product [Gongylonema pulchrum]|uniref:DEAD domain-containing protein n=1 Tax=Gongylonema pulchrum TaxID=637853 RepID=A0A183DA72_9BILA|nr:unnamed protein product [Gongylonema pulchrum]
MLHFSCEDIAEFKKYNVFNTCIVSLCGSHDLKAERLQLKNAKVAIATPGRLMEHITDLDCPADFTRLSIVRRGIRRAVSLITYSAVRLSAAGAKYLVVDEADRMSQTARIEWLNDFEAVANCELDC